MLCQVLASIDARLAFILVESIKQDLDLSDTQIGLITGPAFSLTYALFAIPIAKLSDRRNRIVVVSCAIVVWSAFTAAAALARGFASFGLTRIGVAIGESALTPAAHSVIASCLPDRFRPKGIALYSLGIGIGALFAFAGGGYIGDRYGWRAAFLAIGGGGLLLAVLVMATVREPLREALPRRPPNTQGSVRSLFGNPVARHLIMGGALLGFSSGALNGWGPTYVMRNFDLSATQAGTAYGALAGLLAMAGILSGGVISSWLSARHPRYALQMLAGVFFLATATQVGSLLADDYPAFLALFAVTVLLSAFYIGPTYAAIQSIVASNERSFASAVTLFCINGVGIASGTFIVGLLSDALEERAGTDSLQWSLIAVSVVKAWSALHYCLASRGFGRIGDAAHAPVRRLAG